MKNSLFIIGMSLILLSGCGSSKKVNTTTKEKEKPKPAINIASHIGKTYSDAAIFKNYEYIGGRTLEGRHETYQGKEFAASHFEYRGQIVIAFFEEIQRNAKDELKYKILDQLVVQKSTGDEHLLLDCASEKYPQTEIICLCEVRESDWHNKEYFDNVKKAWRLDRKKGKISEIKTKDIRGINSAYGL